MTCNRADLGIGHRFAAGVCTAAARALAGQRARVTIVGLNKEYALMEKSIMENPMLNGETIRLNGAIRMGLR